MRGYKCFVAERGASEAQWVMQWSVDIVVLGSISTAGRYLLNHKQGSIALILSLSPSNCPDMTDKNR